MVMGDYGVGEKVTCGMLWGYGHLEKTGERDYTWVEQEVGGKNIPTGYEIGPDGSLRNIKSCVRCTDRKCETVIYRGKLRITACAVCGKEHFVEKLRG